MLAALQQRLSPPLPGNAFLHMQHLHAACKAMTACVFLAPACGVSSEAQLQLARQAVTCVGSSGLSALAVWTAWLANGHGDLWQGCFDTLRTQLELAQMSLWVPGWSAAAAAEAALPEQLAAWLTAAVRLLQRMGEGNATGGQPACTLLLLQGRGRHFGVVLPHQMGAQECAGVS